MDNYSKEDVVNAFKSLNSKVRKRVLVDQRSYLIGILVYRFSLSEHTIATLCDVKRTKVNHNKDLPVNFHADKSYMQNVYVYAQMFPFDFSKITPNVIIPKTHKVELSIEKSLYNKLKHAGDILGHTDIRITIKLFLEKSLKLWEE